MNPTRAWSHRPGLATSIRRFALTLAVTLATAPAQAQSEPGTAMDGRWHFFVAPYVWASGMEGQVGVGGPVSVPIDLSFGDTLEKLDFALLGRVEARRDRLGFGLDVAYLNLGADVVGPVGGQQDLGADVRSLTVEGVLTWRLASREASGTFVDLLGGGRFLANRAGLTVERDGAEVSGTGKSLEWVDALAGARGRVALGRRLALHARADLAGLGSDFTWNLQGGIESRLGARWKAGAGYRYLDVDYDDGEGRVWQVVYQGPYAFLGYAW